MLEIWVSTLINEKKRKFVILLSINSVLMHISNSTDFLKNSLYQLPYSWVHSFLQIAIICVAVQVG